MFAGFPIQFILYFGSVKRPTSFKLLLFKVPRVARRLNRGRTVIQIKTSVDYIICPEDDMGFEEKNNSGGIANNKESNFHAELPRNSK